MRSGFLESLFDWDFNSLVVARLAKYLYIIAVVFASVVASGIVAGGSVLAEELFAENQWTGAVAVLVAPMAWIGIVLASRVVLEHFVVLFRISEHTYGTYASLSGETSPNGDSGSRRFLADGIAPAVSPMDGALLSGSGTAAPPPPPPPPPSSAGFGSRH